MSSQIGPLHASANKYAPPSQADEDSSFLSDEASSREQESVWTSFTNVLKSDQSEEFAVFKLKKGSAYFPIYLCVIQTLFNLWRCYFVTDPGVPLALRLVNYVKVIVPVCGWVYIYRYNQYDRADTLSTEGKRIIWLGNVCILAQAVFSGLMSLVWAITFPQCGSDACLQDFPPQIIPLGLLFHQVCGGVAMPLFYTCHDVSVALLAVVITYTTMIATAVVLDFKTIELFYILFSAVIISMTFVSYEGSRLSNFASFSDFESALRVRVASENKEYLMKIQTEEMRHMIGEYRYVTVCCSPPIPEIINHVVLI
jgi:hypothetical protein